MEEDILPTISDIDTVEQSVDIPVEENVPGDNQDSSEVNIPESNSISDPADELNDDDKRKFRHSDSIYLLRKKVKNDSDNDDQNTSDDDSQLSSIDEPMDDVN